MAEKYISAEAFKLKTQVEMTEEKAMKPTDAGFHNFLDAIYSLIVRGVDDMSAADVVEVKRGEWKHLGGDEWCCSRCGFVITTGGSWEHPHERGNNFCKHCGADMRGEKTDE